MTIEAFKQIFVLLIGVILVVNGFKVINKGVFKLGIGGRAVAGPLIHLSIKGIAAVIFGISNIISGFIILIYVSLIYDTKDANSLDMAFSIGSILIIVILTSGLIVGFIIQIITELITVVRNDKKSN